MQNPPPHSILSRSVRGSNFRFLPLLAAGALSWSVTAAQAQSYSKLVVFGDSLSDTGNHADRSVDDFGVRFPTWFFNYTNNRYTSGPDTRPVSATFKGVWIEQLATDFLGLPKPKPSEMGGLDFAYGDGRTSDGTHQDVIAQISPLINTTYSLTIDDMGLQVTHFLSGGAVDGKALYCLWGANNDLTSVNPTPRVCSRRSPTRSASSNASPSPGRATFWSSTCRRWVPPRPSSPPSVRRRLPRQPACRRVPRGPPAGHQPACRWPRRGGNQH